MFTRGHFEDIRGTVQSGQLIRAIKDFRSLTSLGLKDSKHLVEAIRDGSSFEELGARLQALSVRVDLAGTGFESAESSSESSKSLEERLRADPEILDALSKNRKIVAIKRCRELSGWGLKEAKMWIEAFATQGIPEAPPLESFIDFSEVRQLASVGQKMAAVERYRELTGADLYEARAFVDKLVREEIR